VGCWPKMKICYHVGQFASFETSFKNPSFATLSQCALIRPAIKPSAHRLNVLTIVMGGSAVLSIRPHDLQLYFIWVLTMPNSACKAESLYQVAVPT